LLTSPEWGYLALDSLRNCTLPRGSTNKSKHHADKNEKGVIFGRSGKTLTGSGPITWARDHTAWGVQDLCGNVWEMIRGLRIRNGILQIVENNDAAIDIDLTPDSPLWQDIKDTITDTNIKISAGNEIRITIDNQIEGDCRGAERRDVLNEIYNEKLRALAIYAGESEAYFHADSSYGEYLPIRGGSWSGASSAGVFALSLFNPRAYSGSSIGFRSAFLP
jgi:formylglycine-generating enzyme required for sulfatase activity